MTVVHQFADALAANDLAAAAALARSFDGGAAAAAQVALDTHTSDPGRSRISVAALLMFAGDPARAVVEARAAAVRDPHHRSSLGSILVAAEQFTEAVEVLRAVVAETPADRDAHINLATAAFKLGDYGAAMSGYARAFDLDPRDGKPLHNLTAMLMEMGKWLGALAALEVSRRGDPPPDVAVALDLVSMQLLLRVAGEFPQPGVHADADRTVHGLLVNASKRGPRSQLVAARALADVERFAEAGKLVHNLNRDPSLTPADRAALHVIEGLIAANDGYATTAIERYRKALAADAACVDAATNAIALLLANGSRDALEEIAAILGEVDAVARSESPELAADEASYRQAMAALAP